MRSRLLITALVALSSITATAQAQRSALADGLIAGDYLRVSGGGIAPINAQGSLKNWDRGKTLSVLWENWQAGSSGVGLIGFGLGIDYSQLPLNVTHFTDDVAAASSVRPTNVSSPSATSFLISTTVRVRIPSPIIMPSLQLGFGYLDFRPATVHYTTPTETTTASQRHRRGAAFTIGAGLDKRLIDRFALFGEALYTYGFTSIGQGFVTPGGTCTTASCDVFKNTTLGVIRGGLRVRVGR